MSETLSGYQSANGWMRPLRVLLTASVMLAGVALASSIVDYRIISRLLDDAQAVSPSQISASDDRRLLLAIIQLVALGVTGVFFIGWTRRLYRNLAALGVRTQFSHGWAVGAWFVPFLNLVRPKQIVDEIWQKSDVDDDSAVPLLLHVWWVTWIASWIVNQILFRSGSVDSLEGAHSRALGIVAGDVLDLLGAVLAFWVVVRVTRRQDAAAAATMQEATGAELPTLRSEAVAHPRRRRLGWVGLPALGVVTALVAFSAWYPTFDSSGNPGSQSSALIDELTVGACYNAPAITDTVVEVVAVGVVPCRTRHDAEVFAQLRHPADASAPFPGKNTLLLTGLTACVAEFDAYVGTSYFSSGLDILVAFPMRADWQGGDRSILCSVLEIDGRRLQGSARASGGVVPDGYDTGFALRPGACFDDPDRPGGFVIRVVSCDEPHDNELYAVVEHPAGPTAPYPGDEFMTDFTARACEDRFEAISTSVPKAGLDHSFAIAPTEHALWNLGLRTVSCMLWDRDFDKLRGQSVLGLS